ncbi:MAG: hypothetical protein AB4290_23370 [Spirulina sp.]
MPSKQSQNADRDHRHQRTACNSPRRPNILLPPSFLSRMQQG